MYCLEVHTDSRRAGCATAAALLAREEDCIDREVRSLAEQGAVPGNAFPAAAIATTLATSPPRGRSGKFTIARRPSALYARLARAFGVPSWPWWLREDVQSGRMIRSWVGPANVLW